MRMKDRLLITLLFGLASCGCWTTTIISPAEAPVPGSVGTGITADTFSAGLSDVTIFGVGLAAHSPPDCTSADECDSYWQVIGQTNIAFCAQKKTGNESYCTLAEFKGRRPAWGNVLSIVGPYDIRQLPDDEDPSAYFKSYFNGRAIWVSNVLQLYRCDIENNMPVCKEAKL